MTPVDIDKLKAFCEKRTIVLGEDECWPWTGGKAWDGRGGVNIPGFRGTAPRAALILAKGMPAFDRAEACHSCDNPNCVNPNHLWWGTHRDNFLDASAKKRLGNGRTHCKRGHEFTPDNVMLIPGGRRCRECENLAGIEKRRLAGGKQHARWRVRG